MGNTQTNLWSQENLTPILTSNNDHYKKHNSIYYLQYVKNNIIIDTIDNQNFYRYDWKYIDNFDDYIKLFSYSDYNKLYNDIVYQNIMWGYVYTIKSDKNNLKIIDVIKNEKLVKYLYPANIQLITNFNIMIEQISHRLRELFPDIDGLKIRDNIYILFNRKDIKIIEIKEVVIS